MVPVKWCNSPVLVDSLYRNENVGWFWQITKAEYK